MRHCTARVALCDLEADGEQLVADLRQPVAAFEHEVEREAVAPGRDQAEDVQLDRGAVAGRERRRGVRSPSQWIALPRSSSQWYETKTSRQAA